MSSSKAWSRSLAREPRLLRRGHCVQKPGGQHHPSTRRRTRSRCCCRAPSRARRSGGIRHPAHQFPLGASLSLDRRLALLAWAQEASAFILEDDYDSEYRFEEHPISALQGLDTHDSVIFLGGFNKALFPSLRLGYAVVPPALLDPVLVLRLGSDVAPPNPDQAILCDFIAEGHLGRHIRRMRNLYAARLAALHEVAQQYLAGILEISSVRAGLSTVGILRNGMTSREAESLATANKIEVLGFHRLFLGKNTVEGLLLGFVGFTEREIRRGVRALAKALESSAQFRPRA